MDPKICKICDKLIIGGLGYQKYHKGDCSRTAKRKRTKDYAYRRYHKIRLVHEPKKCAIDGKQFTPKRFSELYCCKACSKIAELKRTKGYSKKRGMVKHEKILNRMKQRLKKIIKL